MKNKLSALRERMLNSEKYKKLPRPIRWIIGSLSNNLGYKLLSLLLAILLWNYVITTNTSITRMKTIYGLTGNVTGQSVLTNNQLAMTEDPSTALSGLAVTVEAPQADFSRVSSDNIQVSLDLANVRAAGTQEVALRASSTYGRVRSISPQSLTLTFENLDARNVTVNPDISGEMDGYWYNVSRVNPSSVTVSGAASVVQSIASARVSVDVTGMKNSTVKVLPFELLDQEGNVIPQTMLNRSTSSISVSIDIYPCREIPFATDTASLVTGTPARGYVVDSVTVQPQSAIVAADQDLLDSLTQLMVDPVPVNGVSQSFTARAAVSQLSDFKNVSSEQVYVNVNIVEETITGFVDNVKVVFSNTADNLVASYEPLGVYVTGPKSAVEALQQSGMTVNLDLEGYGAGYYLLGPTVDNERYPDLTFESEAVSVTLTDVSTEEADVAE